MKIALAGNPNCGKTTLFNALTGANQKVGNYAGVTVEKKTGSIKIDGKTAEIVDLPGTYGLTGFSEDEIVARRFLIEERPDLVVSVLDASNLERSLNLTLQFIEMGMNVVVALNMVDVAESKGHIIDGYKLSQALGVKVASTVGRKNKGIDNLVRKIAEAASEERKKPIKVSYSNEIDNAIKETKKSLVDNKILENTELSKSVPFWVSLKLIEQDTEVTNVLKSHGSPAANEILSHIDKLSAHVENTLDDSLSNIISDHRYGVIKSLTKKCKEISPEKRRHISDKIDLVLTNRFLGPVILLGILWYLYQFTFAVSEVPVGWVEEAFGWLNETVSAMLPDGLLKSLIVSGIIDGVGGVLGFAPLIMFMFFMIAIIEDSGYMARIAFILDRVLRAFGIHGNSILSYIVSGGIAGGCAVPGVMAARTLRDPKERMATIFTAPFMNCGAKLPVFALFIAAFFPNTGAKMMFLITILSWAFAMCVALILRKTIFKGESSPFIMELPPYRMPTLRGLLTHTWQRTWSYVKKAGTYILAASIIVWAAMTFPTLDESRIDSKDPNVIAEKQLEYSVAGRVGKAMEVVTKPLVGFDWRTDIALLAGAAAKEVIVATLGTAYSLGEVDPEESESLAERLQKSDDWNPLMAFALIVFVILYMPCVAVLGVIKSETGSWKWTIFSATYTTGLASILAIAIYQIGSLFGLGN